MKSVEERFWCKVKKTNYCWNWIAFKNHDGYGRFRYKNKTYQAHRVSWEIHFNTIPKNQYVLHKCDNPACVNPEHLFLGTQLDNIKDKVKKNRQHRDGGQKGQVHHSAKLTDIQILELRNKYESGKFTQYDLAKHYGINQPQIHRIVKRKLWKHL